MKVVNRNTARTSTAEPAASAMTYGELAINYHADNPRLLIKDSTNKVIGFPSEKRVNKELESVSNTISGLTKNISNNRTDIEMLEAWVVSPLNTAEIESAFV